VSIRNVISQIVLVAVEPTGSESYNNS